MSRPEFAPTVPPPFPRYLAVIILLCMGCAFAGNHVAARVAFDDGAGVLLAILMRSGGTLLVLAILVLWQRQSLRLPAGAWRWQLLLGLLITAQSLCLYSAVARVPVALALLVANVFPILLALLTWALGGPRPSARTAMLMGLILMGLVFVLDVPGRLSDSASVGPEWLLGVALAFCAASVFACALWITDHKLSQVRGSVRSLLTIFIVFSSVNLAGLTGALPGGLNLPRHLNRLAGPCHARRALWDRLHCVVHFRTPTGHATQRPGDEYRTTGDVVDGLDCAGSNAQQRADRGWSNCSERDCFADVSQSGGEGWGEG